MTLGILVPQTRGVTWRTNLGKLRGVNCPGMYKNPTKGHNQKLQLGEHVHNTKHVGISLVHNDWLGENVEPKRVLDAIKNSSESSKDWTMEAEHPDTLTNFGLEEVIDSKREAPGK